MAVYGGLDVVYNNAALPRSSPLPGFSIADGHTTIAGRTSPAPTTWSTAAATAW